MMALPDVLQYVAPVSGTFLLAVVVYNLLKAVQRSRKLPPGPLMPLFTMQSEAPNDPDELLANKKYGEVTSFRILNLICVMANNHATISQMLLKNGDYSSGRDHTTFYHHLFNFSDGVIGADGEEWRQRRSFILGVFRQFGFTKYELPIERERDYLIEQIKKTGSVAFNPLMLVNSAVSNIIYQLLFGERMDRDEMKRFEVIITQVNDFMTDQDFNNNWAIDLLGRSLYLIPGDPFHIKRQYKNMTTLGEFFDEQIARKKAEPVSGDATCLLDALMQQPKFKDMHIRQIMFDLLIAGMETTTTTLRWAIILMAKNPEVQRRVRAEINEQLEGKPPAFNDRAALVYTEAVIHEIERYVTIVPFSIPHRAVEDFTVNDYLVPKNSILLPNLYAAHHDEKVWPYASTFNPANFYDESKKSLINLDYLIPFSLGKRACLGETLAKQELFIFFASLMQNFEFVESDSQPLPSLKESIITIVRSPKPFVIVAKPTN